MIPPLLPIPSQIYPVHNFPPSFHIQSNVSLPSTFRSSEWLWVSFRNMLVFDEELLAPAQPLSWRTTRYRLSATAYSVYSQNEVEYMGRNPFVTRVSYRDIIPASDSRSPQFESRPGTVIWILVLLTVCEVHPRVNFRAWCDVFLHHFTIIIPTMPQPMKIVLWVDTSSSGSRDSPVGTATGYWLDERMIGVRFPAGAGNFSLRHHVQTGSGSHPASYPVGTGGSFPGGKAAGAWSWPLTSI
jgi:hypothetical protein